jgi:hypothetical protein
MLSSLICSCKPGVTEHRFDNRGVGKHRQEVESETKTGSANQDRRRTVCAQIKRRASSFSIHLITVLATILTRMRRSRSGLRRSVCPALDEVLAGTIFLPIDTRLEKPVTCSEI